MGIAPTRDACPPDRWSSHISVNGKVVNIPSYTVKPGDVVVLRAFLNHWKLLQDR